MVKVSIGESTIPHEVVGKFGKSVVILKPAPEGRGVIAGASVRSVVELAGIKNITTKSYGSRNSINTVKATFEGLKSLRSAEKIAALRGKKFSDRRLIMDKKLKITLIKSTSGRLEKQKRTVEALGLTKIHSSVIVNDNDAVRGMIFVVKHLVKVEEI